MIFFLVTKRNSIFRLQTIQEHTVNFTFLRTKYFGNLKFPRNNLCKNENIQRECAKNKRPVVQGIIKYLQILTKICFKTTFS